MKIKINKTTDYKIIKLCLTQFFPILISEMILNYDYLFKWKIQVKKINREYRQQWHLNTNSFNYYSSIHKIPLNSKLMITRVRTASNNNIFETYGIMNRCLHHGCHNNLYYIIIPIRNFIGNHRKTGKLIEITNIQLPRRYVYSMG